MNTTDGGKNVCGLRTALTRTMNGLAREASGKNELQGRDLSE
ncbi:hypothetical protein [Streptobacillus moniliformis]|nr:hypothetical protein [Streptobacillus moniliformis]